MLLPAANKEIFQNFLNRLNSEPNPESIDTTADGKAYTILISHVEMLLDEFFFGLWETDSFTFKEVNGRMYGSINLTVTFPFVYQKINRAGAHDLPIIKGEDFMLPILKAECTKNAAKSLGKVFGRDLNREKVASYEPQKSETMLQQLDETLNRIREKQEKK